MASEHRRIKSYVLRQGRLTRGQQQALEQHWSDFGIEYQPQALDLAAVFGNTHDVVLEIGFGNGESLVQQAEAQPHSNFIGIEVHRPGVGHCLHRLVELGLSNLRLINQDAIDVMQHQLRDNCLAQIQLFFPDPWQKKRHHKRRILQSNFLDLASTRLRDGGHLHLATDWEDYAEHMQLEMQQRKDFTLVTTDRGDRPVTKFENRGLKLGHGVWDFVYALHKG